MKSDNDNKPIILGKIPEGSEIGDGSVVITDPGMLAMMGMNGGGIAIGYGACVFVDQNGTRVEYKPVEGKSTEIVAIGRNALVEGDRNKYIFYEKTISIGNMVIHESVLKMIENMKPGDVKRVKVIDTESRELILNGQITCPADFEEIKAFAKKLDDKKFGNIKVRIVVGE